MARLRPRAHERKGSRPVPPAPKSPPSRSPLEALGLEGVDEWSVDKLSALSVAELLAVTFDMGDADPALSMMRSVSNDLTALVLAHADPDMARSADIANVLHRLSMTALVAAELHRRELAAARAA